MENQDTPEYYKELNLFIDGDVVSDPFLVSEKFNDYFTNVVKNLVTPEPTWCRKSC